MDISYQVLNRMGQNQDDGYEVGTSFDWIGQNLVSENSEQVERERIGETQKKFRKTLLVTTLLMVLLVGFITFAVLFGVEKDKRKQYLQRQVDSLKKGWKCFNDTPVDCRWLYDKGVMMSGVYIICPWKRGETNLHCVQVYCDMETDGGGWTVIQRRQSGDVSFERNWEEYKMGFGDVFTSYWIGNDIIHQLTKEKSSSLYMEITLFNETVMFMKYEFFFITDENTDYILNISGKATGTLEDRIRNVPPSDMINGAKFSTYDKDNDQSKTYSCAVDHQGGWWYNYCHDVYLNGPYSPGEWPQPWFPPLPDGSNITNTRMMIRRKKM
ncbi:microfibril-associated glycoprotein 4-like [Saccostrea echinata]|uniref:microfibril-associated glycoprotein 4-like n=1 Tax=Saccostrea echinata TaxID=191078 RepID=UPI002A8035B0|nr:microfibril-associated glycoprotein 4-like [Saccostrea echinata]